MYLWVRANQVPPLAAIVAATESNREAYGSAVSIDGQIVREVGCLDWTNPADTHKSIMEWMETFKEAPRMMWFSDSVVATEQPYSIFDDGDPDADPPKPAENYQAVACFDGDYTKHDSDDSSEAPEKIAFDLLVKPKLDAIAIELGGDASKFFDALNKNATDLTTPLFSDDSSMVIFLATGHFFNAGASDSLGKDFSWGHMSNPYDFTGEAAKAKPGLLTLKGATPKNVSDEMDKATGKVVLMNQGPPKSIKQIKDIILWYQTWNTARDSKGVGIVPKNPGKRPQVEIDKNKWEADPNFRNVAGAAAAASGNGTAAGATPKAALLKSTAATNAGSGVQRVKFVPTLNAKELADLTGKWKAQEFINEDAGAASLSADEVKFPSFESQSGVAVNDLAKHKPESIEYLVDHHPKLATSLIIELLRGLKTAPKAAPKKAALKTKK